MQMELSLRAKLEQRMVLAPQIIQSIEILQLPLLALRERIEQEQLENPTLEIIDDERLGDGQARLDQARESHDAKITEGEDFTVLQNMPEEFREYFAESASHRPKAAASGDRDDKMEAMQNTPSPSGSLREFLVEQLHLLELRPGAWQVAENIVNNLDRDGRLAFPLEEIAASMDVPPPPSDAEAALRAVQSLDPKGVGARSLEECLLLQLDADDLDYELHQKLIRNHLLDIEHNRFPKIAKDLGIDIEAVKRGIAYVCSLHPAPGRLYDTEMVPYVVPDVLVELVEGEYVVTIDEHNIPRLRVSRMYEQMLSKAQANTEARDYLRKKTESSRWLIDSIEQRRTTLLKVAREMVRRQTEFFDRGISSLRPLKMQEVADATGMHVATVSRAVRHKYMQTPRGIFPMKFFFTGGMSMEGGEDQAWDAVKQQIRDLVDKEDKKNPLSDDAIVDVLNKSGITIARRTVTKYRKTLDIPSSRQRKAY